MSAGETRQVRVRVLGDAVPEDTESFTLRLWDNVGVALGDATGVGTIQDDDQAPTRWQPDAEVRHSAGTYRGGDVYNTTGAGQSVTVGVARGRSTTFYVRVRNDGDAADSWSIAESRSQTRRITRDWWSGGRNVTAGVAAGTFALSSVPVGDTRLLRLTVRPGARAPVGKVATWSVHAVHNPLADRVRDVVRIQVRVRR